MIVCSNCGKENQDHYKFCLGCGSDLPRGEQEDQSSDMPTPTPPSGTPTASEETSPPPPAPTTEDEAVPAPAPESTPDSKPETEPTAEPEAAPPTSTPPKTAPTDAVEEQEPAGKTEPAGPVTDAGAADDQTAPQGLRCESCGSAIQEGFAFCGSCGTPVPGVSPPISEPPAAKTEPGARLVLIQPDGTEGGHVDIPTSEVAIGRDAGGFFGNDPFLSPTHAVFHLDGEDVHAKDSGSLNGLFVKIKPNNPVEIQSGDIFRIGQELIQFEEIDRGTRAADGTEKMGSPMEGLWGRVALIVGRDRLGNAFPIGGDGIVMGRERGNILFPEDGYVSGVHVKLYTSENKFYLSDLGSSNGTFLKVQKETTLTAGSFLLMGQQLFRIDL